MLGFYVVHSLSRRRDNEKAIADAFDRMVERADAIEKVVMKGWSARAEKNRESAVADALWELQRLGAAANLMNKRSKRLAWKSVHREIDLNPEMAAFRDALTGGDFEDTQRAARPSEVSAVRLAKNLFIGGVQIKVLGWY